MFTGIIGRKIGMTQLFQENGEAMAVTAIQAGPSVVTQIKSRDRDGYDAIQVGFIENKVKQSQLNSSEKGHLRGLENVRYLREFRTDDISSVKMGDKVDVGFLKQGDLINVTGFSKGKGFAGVVKRYHFAGGPKTHGQTDRHRAPGSIGATTFPGRVLKGKRMAGHMGNRRVTAHNLEVIQADPESNLLLVKGAVPGATGGLLIIEKVR
ncbi:MAG: 50S ribosomal protein L3 [Dehalococcoidia bacterium]|nr:MAG: 50S ribosomal protein L3 [Dehalococcoidia bacterium]TEU17124.1 MAG: 50S ribosomal protein L3 [Dehalococcoidia bacterium]